MIYVNGDSFTAGTGLSDHEFIPEFEKYNNISYQNYHNMRIKYIHLLPSKDPLMDAIIAYDIRNKELSWPILMSRILGTEVINTAQGGSSMSSILYRTLLDLTKLKMEGVTPKTVIIMLTCENRITLVQTHAVIHEPTLQGKQSWIRSIVLSQPLESNHPFSSIVKETVLRQSKNDLITKWLLEVALLKNVVKSLTGTYPIIAAPMFVTNQVIKHIKNEKLINHPHFFELIQESGILNMNPELIMQPINILPDGHYDNETHAVFAEKISTYIQTLNDKEKNI